MSTVAAPAAGERFDARDPGCFHCGLPIPAGPVFAFESVHGRRAFCCAGCEAISRSISGLGLDDYYRLRERAAARAESAACAPAEFDEPSVRARYVRDGDDGSREAQLVVEGLRCAACAWLVEQVVARLPGIESVEVNYALRRARVRWRGELLPSAVFAAVQGVGYAAWPYDEQRLTLVEANERRHLLRRLWVAGLGMMQVMMYAVPTYIAGEGEVSADAASLMRWAGLVLTLPVMLYSAAPFFAGAWRDARIARLGMDVPVALGLAVAFFASAWATAVGTGEVYFDSVTMFVFLLLGGRYLELLARSRASASLLRLARLVPQSAHRLRDRDTLATMTIPAASLRAGDRILVRPGETVPADGVLETLRATVSEALMSGESRPLSRERGDAVLGGSVNTGSALVLAVTRVGDDTTLAAIHRLMQRALAERPHWVESARAAVPVFVALVLVASVAAGVAWLSIDPARALWVAVSVLIVTCPCALALATPAAVTAAMGALARHNVVVTRGHAIEALAACTDVVFDKTGTLTRGEPDLVETLTFNSFAAPDALAIATSLAMASTHPLDGALRRAGEGVEFAIARRHEAVPGEGIEAEVAGTRVRLGRACFAGALHGQSPPAFRASNDPVAWLANEHGWIAAFRFSDVARPEARNAVRDLHALGLRLHLLSGDERDIVDSTATALGIERSTARAIPDVKRRYVGTLQAGGARVAMVGDGINDAPVLAQADVSIAMGGGADLAKLRADAVLLSDSPADLAAAVRIARKARRIVRQNLGWALAYNLVAIPLAALGLVTPLVAGIGMSASSLLVVANSLRAR